MFLAAETDRPSGPVACGRWKGVSRVGKGNGCRRRSSPEVNVLAQGYLLLFNSLVRCTTTDGRSRALFHCAHSAIESTHAASHHAACCSTWIKDQGEHFGCLRIG